MGIAKVLVLIPHCTTKLCVQSLVEPKVVKGLKLGQMFFLNSFIPNNLITGAYQKYLEQRHGITSSNDQSTAIFNVLSFKGIFHRKGRMLSP